MEVQGVQMKDIQNKIIMSQKTYTHLWVTPLQREATSVFFWVYDLLNKFQNGLRWLHDKYADDIRPRFMLLEAFLVLP
jgi:hypothetical protein